VELVAVKTEKRSFAASLALTVEEKRPDQRILSM
jgi:hypothetical protein